MGTVVRALTHVPDALRPWLFGAGVFLFFWWLIVRRGLAAVAAVVAAVGALAGALLLLADYFVADKFARNVPGVLRSVGDGVDRVRGYLDSLCVKLFGLRPSAAVPGHYVVVFLIAALVAGGPWAIMSNDPASAAAQRLLPVYDRWRGAEVEAGVPALEQTRYTSLSFVPLLTSGPGVLGLRMPSDYAAKTVRISTELSAAGPKGRAVGQGVLDANGALLLRVDAKNIRPGWLYRIEVGADSFVVLLP